MLTEGLKVYRSTTLDDLNTKVEGTKKGVADLKPGDEKTYDQLRFDSMDTADLLASRLTFTSKYGKMLKAELFDRTMAEFLPLMKTIEELASKGNIDDVDRQILYTAVARLQELTGDKTADAGFKKMESRFGPIFSRLGADKLTKDDWAEIFQLGATVELIGDCYSNYAQAVSKYFGLENDKIENDEMRAVLKTASGLDKKLDRQKFVPVQR